MRRHAVAARVEIPVPQDVFQRKLSELPEGITLTCGRLEVEFTGVEELLCKLFELSQAAANDFERFQAAVESGKGA